MEKKVLVIIILVLMVSSGFVSAGWFSDLFGVRMGPEDCALLGDADEDGEITLEDAQLIFDMTQEVVDSPEDITCLDINEDEELNNQDVKLIFNLWLDGELLNCLEGQALGDVDGDREITEFDAQIINFIKLELVQVSDNTECMDVNGDGDLGTLDSSLILQYVEGIISDFPSAITQINSPLSCAGDQVILKLTTETNSHGAVASGVGGVAVDYSALFEECYYASEEEDVSECSGENLVLALSGVSNAHASTNKGTGFETEICYGDLVCEAKSVCATGEVEVVTLSTNINAHLALRGYPVKICCTSANSGEPIIPVGECGNSLLEGTEECDDGNVISGDGCSSDCKFESVPSPCPEGTELCSDETCSLDCDVTDEGVAGCDDDGECEDGEGCSCEDCDGEIDTCAEGLLCSLEDTGCCKIISDGECNPYCKTIDPDCRGPVDAVCGNNICEVGEECDCSDCHGEQDGCLGSQVCSFVTKACADCPTGTSFDSTTKTCKPKTFFIEIIHPDSDLDLSNKRFAISEKIGFNQTSKNSAKDISIEWSFGDGADAVEVENCQTTGNCNTTHSFSKRGHYVISATAKEQGGINYRTNYTDILVYGTGLNVFAIISEPSPWEIINGGKEVEFNANKSFVANCSATSVECDSSSDDCYSITGGTSALYCYDLNKSEIGKSYDLLFEWTFKKGANFELNLSGTWGSNYLSAVEFNKSFPVRGNYTAELKVIYGSYVDDGEENCAEEGGSYSLVDEGYPNNCCIGLTEWTSGLDARVSIDSECYDTLLIKGSNVGTCLKLSDEICGDLETPCNSPDDCSDGTNADYATVDEFCDGEDYDTYCGEDILGSEDLDLCKLCVVEE
ncbi:MAG: dockerin type I domain-containing protein [Nanoarchaeota archaeon]|nr:dockerin type I domain-containing protein [Nanoarchaeota archaeon]